MLNFNEIDGYIFDMDGTLIDSMGMWRDSGNMYLESMKIKKEKDFPLVQCGKEYNELTLEFIKYYNLGKDLHEVKREFEKIVSPLYLHELQLKEGVYDYLLKLKKQGKKMCVATATQSDLARPCLNRLGVGEFFDIILSTKDIGINKYQPDVYLKCCEIMGTQPNETAVFEDAIYAAKTALAADFKVVGIYDDVFKEDFETLNSICHLSIKSYKEL